RPRSPPARDVRNETAERPLRSQLGFHCEEPRGRLSAASPPETLVGRAEQPALRPSVLRPGPGRHQIDAGRDLAATGLRLVLEAYLGSAKVPEEAVIDRSGYGLS